MKICSNCTLSDNIFSVKINENGLCNYCEQHAKHTKAEESTLLEEKEQQFRKACSEYSHLPYQVLLAYSGGKDSSYTLYLLRKKYGLSVLAVTFDNGFLTQQCRQNIHEVTSNLGVDNITIKPSFSKLAKAFQFTGENEVFPKKAMERASSICTSCIGFVKAAIYREAILRRIPFVSFGWTPGQINAKGATVKLDYRMLLANQNQLEKPLVSNLGSEFKKYFLDAEWLEANQQHIPSLAHPLAFSDYDEHSILKTIEGLGWQKPLDTDTNSTNCLLNTYANALHERQYGYNPYCLEVAGLVRDGYLSREQGFQKLQSSGQVSVISYVRSELQRHLGESSEQAASEITKYMEWNQ